MSEDLSAKKSPVLPVVLGLGAATEGYFLPNQVKKVGNFVTQPAKYDNWEALIAEQKDTFDNSIKEVEDKDLAEKAKTARQRVADGEAQWDKEYEAFKANDANKYEYKVDAEKMAKAEADKKVAEDTLKTKRQAFVEEEAAKLRNQEVAVQAKKAGITNPNEVKALAEKYQRIAKQYTDASKAYADKTQAFEAKIADIAKLDPNKTKASIIDAEIDRLISEEVFGSKEKYEAEKARVDALRKEVETLTEKSNGVAPGSKYHTEYAEQIKNKNREIQSFESKTKDLRAKVEESVANRRRLADYGVIDMSEADKAQLETFFSRGSDANASTTNTARVNYLEKSIGELETQLNAETNKAKKENIQRKITRLQQELTEVKSESRTANSMLEAFIKTPNEQNARKLHNLVVEKKASITELQDLIAEVNKEVEQSKPKIRQKSTVQNKNGNVKEVILTSKYTEEKSFGEVLAARINTISKEAKTFGAELAEKEVKLQTLRKELNGLKARAEKVADPELRKQIAEKESQVSSFENAIGKLRKNATDRLAQKSRLEAILGRVAVKDSELTAEALEKEINRLAGEMGMKVDETTGKLIPKPAKLGQDGKIVEQYKTIDDLIAKYTRSDAPNIETHVELPKTAELVKAEKAMANLGHNKAGKTVAIPEAEIIAKAEKAAEGRLGNEKAEVEKAKNAIENLKKSGKKELRTEEALKAMFEKEKGARSEVSNNVKKELEDGVKKLFEKGGKSGWRQAAVVAGAGAVGALLGLILAPRKNTQA